MFKRLLALLFCLLILAPSALAQEGAFATYQLPQGAQACYFTQAKELDVPEGLEPMYNLMQHATMLGDIYLMRMPNGRAMASVGCSPVEQAFSAEELLALWPEIALNLGRECTWVNDDPACAAVENCYGIDMLHINTQLSAGDTTTLLLDTEAFAFCQDGSMIEIWAVKTAQPIYLYDEQAAKELEEDEQALRFFLNSLDFSGQIPSIQSEDYRDPDGRFELQVLTGSVIITAATPLEEISVARERFIEANAAGADNAFDQMMADVYEQRVTLILTPDMKGAMQIFCSQENDFADATPEMLAMLAEPIRKSLNERFGLAVTLANDERATVSRIEHARMCYWLRSGECNLQLDILACVTAGGWLCEVDLFTLGGDQTTRAVMQSLIMQTLRYTVE